MYAGNYKLTHNQPKTVAAAREQEKPFAIPDRNPEVCKPTPVPASEPCTDAHSLSSECSQTADVPQKSTFSENCEDFSADKTECTHKKRFKATRVQTLKEPPCEPFDLTRNDEKQSSCSVAQDIGDQNGEPCPPEKSEAPCLDVKDCARNCKKGGVSSLFSSFSSDELLVVALIILLLCQGCDDILILALCFVLF